MTENSLIFTRAELDELQNRLEGNIVNYKIWYKVKLKLDEMEFWYTMRNTLRQVADLDGRRSKRK